MALIINYKMYNQKVGLKLSYIPIIYRYTNILQVKYATNDLNL